MMSYREHYPPCKLYLHLLRAYREDNRSLSMAETRGMTGCWTMQDWIDEGYKTTIEEVSI